MSWSKQPKPSIVELQNSISGLNTSKAETRKKESQPPIKSQSKITAPVDEQSTAQLTQPTDYLDPEKDSPPSLVELRNNEELELHQLQHAAGPTN